jgi:hypothetical protein
LLAENEIILTTAKELLLLEEFFDLGVVFKTSDYDNLAVLNRSRHFLDTMGHLLDS